MYKFLHRTFVLNMFMEAADVYCQQPPKSMNWIVMQQELLKLVSDNINYVVPIDFCLNEITLNALDSNEYPSSVLEGHENDPLDEKRSNFVEIFVSNVVYLYFNTRANIIIH